MDHLIVPVLLSTSALTGAAAGLRFKVLILVPVALLIALVSAVVLRMYGFGAVSGIVIIVACLVVNQAAYALTQISLEADASEPSFDEVTDGEPATDRKQAVDDDHGNQKSSPSRLLFSEKISVRRILRWLLYHFRLKGRRVASWWDNAWVITKHFALWFH